MLCDDRITLNLELYTKVKSDDISGNRIIRQEA